ncbi:MAG: thioredoxin family protein [Nitrospiraceae bacterium]|nr:thioredoxin family protein [Nitrospiraceae bacterium]
MLKQLIHKGGSFGSLLFLSLLLGLLAMIPGPVSAGGKLRLLYFFNTSCSHCNAVAPLVKELSKTYPTEGWISSPQDIKGYPFPVKVGSKDLAQKYGIQGVPTIVVLRNDKPCVKIAGERDIRNAKAMLHFLNAGALTITEAMESGKSGEIFVAGWISSPVNIIDGRVPLFLSDRVKKIRVKPWLPLGEDGGSRQKKSARTMSEVLNKPVALKGVIEKDAQGNPLFQVRTEVSFK